MALNAISFLVITRADTINLEWSIVYVLSGYRL